MKDFNKLYETYKNIESGHQKKFNKDTLKKFLEKKHNIFITTKPIIVGYLVASFILEEIEIISMAVDLSYRRKGYGDSLIKNIKKLAINKKVKRILLEVSQENYGAVKLYKNNDFKSVGIRKNYYNYPNRKVHAEIMCLNLFY